MIIPCDYCENLATGLIMRNDPSDRSFVCVTHTDRGREARWPGLPQGYLVDRPIRNRDEYEKTPEKYVVRILLRQKIGVVVPPVFSREHKQFRSARFSRDRRWRYTLTREFGSSRDGRVLFVMLNPSTADEEKLDPTCSRCLKYADRWGFGALEVCNVYAWRSTDPRGLKLTDDPVGPRNLKWIKEMAARSDLVVCAWGTHAKPADAALAYGAILSAGRLPHALRLTRSGAPGHPLYLPGDLQPFQWNWRSKLPTLHETM